MQKVFNLTNRYIVLATPLILYSLISSVYLAVSAGSGRVISIILAICLFSLMTAAFMSGWFYMIKQAILEPEREDANSLIKVFPEGVGGYFLSMLGGIVVFFLVFSLVITASYFVGMNTIGDPKIPAEAFSKAIQNTAALKTFVMGLSQEQLIKINLWNFLLLGVMTFTYFLTMLYMPAIFFKEKNPFIAFFISLKDLFSKKILKTMGVFLLIFVVNLILSLISTIIGGIVALHFLMTLINFYFVTIVGVGIFCYYYENFIKQHLGQNVDVTL